jgi:hypothetical protein
MRFRRRAAPAQDEESLMDSHRRKILQASVAAMAIACFAIPEPAQAGRLGSFGAAVIGGAVAGAIIGGMARGGVRRPRAERPRHVDRPRRGRKEVVEESAKEPRKGRDTETVLASLGAPASDEQTAVFKSINASGVVGTVGSTKDLTEVGTTLVNDEDRDYTKKIKELIAKVKDAQRREKDSSAGDITEHAIEQALEKAFKKAKLQIFESFLGENWSAERLRVMILNRVVVEIDRLFVGNNRGNPPMEEVEGLIQKSAEAIYRRIFETSELLAANRGSTLFIQRLYQTHGGLVDDQLREVTDGMITKASTAAVAKYEALLRRDENGFALRYRAQRIIFDCLSETVEQISSSDKGIAPVGEIERNIMNTSTTVCSAWLDHQFGGQTDELKAQKPMPLRVVWSATGPKEDPSMYGRGSSSF